MFFNNKYKYNSSAFTLLEILIVIGILSTLATVVVYVLNPAELLKQSRDAKRLSEIQTLDDAIRFYTFNSGTLYYGTSSVVYLSLPDSNTNCSSYSNLPTLTGGWTYACKPESTYRKVDGTGWIPVNFLSTQAGSSLSILPVDPTNNSSYYYSYIPGSWVLTVKIESVKYLPTAQNDGGSDTARFEIGSNLTLWSTSGAGSTSTTPWARPTDGLVSWWKMDNDWNDSQGTNNGTAYGGATFGTAHNGTSSGSFDGVDDYTLFGNLGSLPTQGSIEFWIYPTSVDNYRNIFTTYWGGVNNAIRAEEYSTGGLYVHSGNGTNVTSALLINGLSINAWYHCVVVWNTSTNNLTGYVNGGQTFSISNTYWPTSITNFALADMHYVADRFYKGLIDEVAVYNRALTPAEITDIYTHTQ